MERKKRSKGSLWEFCYANKIFGTFGDEIKACGQKLVKLCTHTHTHAAKLVVEIDFENSGSTNIGQGPYAWRTNRVTNGTLTLLFQQPQRKCIGARVTLL